ncbi:DUF1963 domain-containing protein [Pseudomonas tohonis]|uniref:DUF1963 domain-containing protein n=1 Tax=Pseudomonas tohonis TaxID=2725477 RepID=UPI001F2387D5|nr:DUF1963 domain-containing protein [Pseudomonas tohonis]
MHDNDEIQAIRHLLARPATRFSAGGFRPTQADEESWLGRVFLFRPDEGIPLDAAGDTMLPLAQFHLPSLPVNHPLLADVRVLALFISAEFGQPLEPMGAHWLIREYGHHETLQRKELSAPASFIKPFPLKAERLDEDYPLWDGGGVPADLEERILELERQGTIDSYYDIVSHCHDHKIGGYPSFCQSGIDPGEGFEFVFQISSDAKINLNVVDSGSLMFWKHRSSGEWALYYDFY